MEYTEKERLMLVDIKREISQNSKKLIENIDNIVTFSSTRYCNDITEILSKVSTLSSYAKPDFELSSINDIMAYMMMLANIVGKVKNDNRLSELKALTYMFVSAINSIQFDFQKKRFSINLKEIKLGNINLSKLI